MITVGCDGSLVPLHLALGQASGAAELDSLVGIEKHLLYAAATRAREERVLTPFARSSPFLQGARRKCLRTKEGATSIVPILLDHLPDLLHHHELVRVQPALAAGPVRRGQRSPEAVELLLRARPAFGHREISI